MKPSRMLRVWTPEDMAILEAAVANGESDEAVADRIGRSVNAVKIRRQRRFPRVFDPEINYGFGHGRPAGETGRTFWTEARVIAGMQDFIAHHRGPLPNSDHDYSRMKKGHLEWPTAEKLLHLWGSMAGAWEAAGAPKSRYTRKWNEWTQEEDDYLLEHAGEQTLKVVARALGRTWSACKRRLYDLGAGPARNVSGYMSILQVAAHYNCPITRVKRLVDRGDLPAKRVVGGNYWRIAPEDCEHIKDRLTAPKRTHSTTPPASVEHRKRLGYRRSVSANGRVVDIPVSTEAKHRDAAKVERRLLERARRVAIERLEAAGAVVDLGVAS